MKLRVAVFDDNDTNRYWLREVMDERGYEVFTFPDPGLCLNNLRPDMICERDSDCVDVIIADLKIPNIFAIGAVSGQMQSGCRCEYFALMNGEWSLDDLQYAERIGCKVFKKPVTKEIIIWLDTVENALKQKRKAETADLKIQSMRELI